LEIVNSDLAEFTEQSSNRTIDRQKLDWGLFSIVLLFEQKYFLYRKVTLFSDVAIQKDAGNGVTFLYFSAI